MAYFGADYKTSFKGKVIIIGAGVSGMTAGYALKELGIDFEILEASDKYGGRIKKVDNFADFPIDLGAEWVHPFVGGGRNVPFLKDIIENKDKEFETFRYSPTKVKIWDTKKNVLKSSIGLNLTMKLVNFFINDLKFKNSTWFDVLTTRVYPKVKGHIRYNEVITNINYEGEKVILTNSKNEIFEADKVLVTVPITILQKNLIQFLPPLPAKKVEAINFEKVPIGMKVFLEFSERFYEDDLYIFESISHSLKNATHGSCIYNAMFGKDSKSHVLGFLLCNSEAERYLEQVSNKDGIDKEEFKDFSEKDSDEVIQLILEDIDKIFEGIPSKTYVKGIVQNWSGERHIQGTYSSMRTSKDYKNRVAPLDEKVYFAGEAMNLKKNMIAVHATAESSYLSLENMLKKYEC